MRAKRLVGLCLCISFTVASGAFKAIKAYEIRQRADNIQEEITIADEVDKNTGANELEYAKVFSTAMAKVAGILADYIDIRGLNVTDKEAINIDGYDPGYVLPDIGSNIYDIFADQTSDFGEKEYEMLEERRMSSQNFDGFYGAIENKLADDIAKPKYLHQDQVYQADPVAELGILLAGVGMAVGYILALQAAGAVLVSTAPVAWFLPYSVPVTLAALATITVVVIACWPIIVQIFQAIVNLFVSMIVGLAVLVRNFFTAVKKDAGASTVSSTKVIGGKTFEFQEVKSEDLATSLSLVEVSRRKNDVYLMQYVKSESIQMALGMPVTEQFCIANTTHRKGLSSYTWYQNVARRLIVKAGTGYTMHAPEIHLIGHDGNMNAPKFAFRHFHNCYLVPPNIIKKCKEKLLKWSHSFFGLLYYSPASDGDGRIHPDNPRP